MDHPKLIAGVASFVIHLSTRLRESAARDDKRSVLCRTSGAPWRDLQFSGPFLEMFSTERSAVSTSYSRGWVLVALLMP
jgi:hypothetical protein